MTIVLLTGSVQQDDGTYLQYEYDTVSRQVIKIV